MSYDSEIVDTINKEYDEYQEELVIRSKGLRLLVDFGDMVDSEGLMSLLVELRDKEVIF